jgi:hypothetical protein
MHSGYQGILFGYYKWHPEIPGEPLAKGYYKWHPERKEKKTYIQEYKSEHIVIKEGL